MERLWAPWRIDYVRSPKAGGCVFCGAEGCGEDRERLIVARGNAAFALLNRYPYTAGHLMIVPYRHVSGLQELTKDEVSDLWTLLLRCKAASDAVFRPHGYNVGLNLGSAAGAGIADHLHLHVVPRWEGDTNFMPVLGGANVVSQALSEMYDLLVHRLRAAAGS